MARAAATGPRTADEHEDDGATPPSLRDERTPRPPARPAARRAPRGAHTHRDSNINTVGISYTPLTGETEGRRGG